MSDEEDARLVRVLLGLDSAPEEAPGEAGEPDEVPLSLLLLQEAP